MKLIYTALFWLALVSPSHAAMGNSEYLSVLNETINGFETALEEGGDVYTYHRWGEPDVVKVQPFGRYEDKEYANILRVLKEDLRKYNSQKDNKNGITSAQAYFQKTKFPDYSVKIKKRVAGGVDWSNSRPHLLPLTSFNNTIGEPSGGKCRDLLLKLEKATEIK